MTNAKTLFQAEYRVARLLARREMVIDGVPYVRADPRKAGLDPLYAPTGSSAAYRAAAAAHYNRTAIKDALPNKFETVFFASIEKNDYFAKCWDEVFGPQTAADFYVSARAKT